MHHTIEEAYIFPILGKRMKQFSESEGLHLESHKGIHDGLERLKTLVQQYRSGPHTYNPTEMRACLDSFREVLFSHLDQEKIKGGLLYCVWRKLENVQLVGLTAIAVEKKLPPSRYKRTSREPYTRSNAANEDGHATPLSNIEDSVIFFRSVDPIERALTAAADIKCSNFNRNMVLGSDFRREHVFGTKLEIKNNFQGIVAVQPPYLWSLDSLSNV
ncbi:hypothetical protein GG344DRAFT_61038 [Lentinula edodes]|nr:hypothetical protein GG344DRAFT_61038 [Lentinula edodes]